MTIQNTRDQMSIDLRNTEEDVKRLKTIVSNLDGFITFSDEGDERDGLNPILRMFEDMLKVSTTQRACIVDALEQLPDDDDLSGGHYPEGNIPAGHGETIPAKIANHNLQAAAMLQSAMDCFTRPVDAINAALARRAAGGWAK